MLKHISDTYEIIEKIGAGNSGEVYKAYHKNLKKYVVLKKIRAEIKDVLNNRAEADVLKNLHHPCLPQVFDFLEADGDVYTVFQKLKNHTVGFRSFIKTSTYSKLTFEYHHLSEFRRGGNKLNRPPHEADIAEQLQHTINSGGAKFDYFSADE